MFNDTVIGNTYEALSLYQDLLDMLNFNFHNISMK